MILIVQKGLRRLLLKKMPGPIMIVLSAAASLLNTISELHEEKIHCSEGKTNTNWYTKDKILYTEEENRW